MLDQNDLQQIKKLFEEGFENAVLKYIKPPFDNLENRIGNLETTVGEIKLEMVTIDYFDRSLADLKGDSIARERKINEKANIATGSLKRNKLLTKQEEEKVSKFQVFPSLNGLRQELPPSA